VHSFDIITVKLRAIEMAQRELNNCVEYFGETISNIQAQTFCNDSSVVQGSQFLATDAEVLDSIPGATRFAEKWVWSGEHSAS
jgi:hypothetical protein